VDCRNCHETSSYEISDFDHETSRFPLEGAHAQVPCGECHSAVDGPEGRRMIRYRPLDQTCTACHRGGV
jgi:nitrate/TMAO reductase-like tetraheme cytochrome c subunit